MQHRNKKIYIVIIRHVYLLSSITVHITYKPEKIAFRSYTSDFVVGRLVRRKDISEAM